MDLTVAPVSAVRGEVRVGGDKSISHRAALVGALAAGETTIANFLPAADCLSTLSCLRALGVEVHREGTTVTVRGAGVRLRPPGRPLDAGNSGTTMRLLAGILAGQPFTAEITGDDSLRRRPMDRVAEPLRRMGAQVEVLGGGRYPPLRITGGPLRGIAYALPVPSAQVKSAVLLAGLFADGETTVVEPVPTRDHTERLLAWLGVPVGRAGDRITVRPGLPRADRIEVPGDISSAAFLLAAAAARPGSEVTAPGLGVNPTRSGVLDALRAMGAEVEVRGRRLQCGEPVADVVVRGRRLRGIRLAGDAIPSVIDELPVLCVIAATAQGVTEIADAAELRVKESDRIAVMAAGLRRLGVDVEERPDGLVIRGGRLRGGRVECAGDHRVAMAFAVAGLLAEEPVTVAGAEAVAISFPDFPRALEAVGTDGG
ncbi:MAG: 3-phosphoshikimate 1-carboxyvinyltransferase [Armatimonadota bacterium]|nr:3-phosphoshikimate 1-carboxyvinyltransferase [Armatimonadota bacterium]MDR7401090.1 3-phosphoshikimate 1-carboxyvinyltransferase [Armatimonadota bacterium]MDR7403558.1 3-phosphoshikimate 1-carboxyvinyltransferase [Armatimonadota bacterium]MDR7436385.1 3-phosphoshikimate 1-carboxyvinyltransferase [Armatimonadota bacterium]MDR7471742.1 3-phosphoshikimate 1-carboxyvinyltransferase [Armatimonadota bacterium]